jgi:predicted secreted protein
MTEPVRARVGEEFELSFEAMPGAGFAWQVEFPTEGVKHVDLLKSEWVPDLKKAGGPAGQRFRFRALSPGRITLEFTYGRRWEASPAERRLIAVEVS